MTDITGTASIDLAAFGASDSEALRLIEGMCRAAIHVRMNILCELSAEEREWSDGRTLVGLAEDYRRLAKMAIHVAESHHECPEWLYFAVMEKVAKEMMQPDILPWQ